ncbi:MAPK-activated protein kinase Srk1 [Coemansia sp. RSA 2607]|nr:MAPK-activated protein kinase Srk1 [Coemansia sp. RSA 2607]
MGIFGGRNNAVGGTAVDFERDTGAAVLVSIEDQEIFSKTLGTTNSLFGGGGRRRRSIGELKGALYSLEGGDTDEDDQDEDEKMQSVANRQRRKSNAGFTAIGDADGNGFPTIEGYTVLSRIGEGAFSKVYRAQQDATGEDVAIKAICKTGLTPVQVANINKEVAIMESLKHPRVIRLHGFCETRDYFYLVMEYAAGGELFDRVLQLTYLSERLARHVIIQVAEAVQYLHANGIVQRDLKLENVVFESIPVIPSGVKEQKRQGDTSEKAEEGLFVPGVGGGGIGRVKLIDFGLSKVVWNQATHTPCGTTGYAAPEVVRDELYTKSVDMWGIGCMLYAMVCGFPPFYDEDVKVLTRKVALGQYEFLSPWWDHVNPQIKELIAHLLELDPARRYTIQDFMRHPWVVEGLNEMYDSAAVAAAARSSVNKRRVGALTGAARQQALAQNLASGWVNIQAVATPLQQRHCWQGTMLGSPVDLHAAEEDLNLISRVLDLPVKKHRSNNGVTTRSAKQAVAAATTATAVGGKFALNMGEATLLKRRFIA